MLVLLAGSLALYYAWRLLGFANELVFIVILGTLVGQKLLKRLPESRFRQVVGLLVLLLGLYMFSRV